MSERRPAIRLIALATAANVLGYMDRVCISIAAPRIQTEFGFSPWSMGIILGAFSLTYALFQAPWGAIADRLGARRIVAGAILAWSAFTGLTAISSNFLWMLVVRLLFGVSEAAISPSVASAFGRFVAPAQRSTAFGIFLAGGRMGGAIGPFLTAFVTVRYGWRAVFFIFAGLGLVAFAGWMAGFPKGQDQTTSSLPRTVSARVHFSGPFVALLMVSFSYTLMWQFYITWFPTYLVQGRGFSLERAGVYAGLPFLFGLIANWSGGLASDGLTRRFGIRVGRRAFGSGALVVSAALLYSGLLAPNPSGALLIALAAGAGDMILSTLWAVALELNREAAGVSCGLLNMASNLGGFASPICIGWVFQKTGNWNLILTLAALCNIFAAVAWQFVAASRQGRLDASLQTSVLERKAAG
jgi:MFS family permease